MQGDVIVRISRGNLLRRETRLTAKQGLTRLTASRLGFTQTPPESLALYGAAALARVCLCVPLNPPHTPVDGRPVCLCQPPIITPADPIISSVMCLSTASQLLILSQSGERQARLDIGVCDGICAFN